MNTLLSKSILSASALVALSVAMFPGAASAGEVNNRDHRQQARINQGVADGQLTHREYNSDERRLNSIEAQRNRDLSKDGGHLTAWQRTHLNRELNGNSRNIYYTKHNFARQPGANKI